MILIDKMKNDKKESDIDWLIDWFGEGFSKGNKRVTLKFKWKWD